MATASRFDTAGRLTYAVTAVILVEHASEEATERTAGLGIAAGCFETTGWLTNGFTAHRSSDFAATGVAGTLVVMEQFVKQTLFRGAASWLDDDFAATGRLTDRLAAANGLTRGVAGGVAAEERFHVAKGTRAGSVDGDQGDGQNSWY